MIAKRTPSPAPAGEGWGEGVPTTAIVLVAAIVASACGPLTPPQKDAGTGGGGATTGGGSATGGGSSNGGGSATGGGSGGGSTGGGTAVGGGAAAGGGTAMTWTFSSIGMTPAPTNSGSIVGLAENDAGIWAMSGSGRLYLSTGGAFTEQLVLPQGQPVDFEGAPTGELFAISTVYFSVCRSSCADAGSWTQTRITASNETMESLCVVSGSHVLAVGSAGGSNDGMYHRYDGQTFDVGSTAFAAFSPNACWRGESGDFFIPVEDAIVVYEPGSLGFTPENTPGMPSWRGGGSALGSEWVAGSGPTIARRSGTNWTNVLTRSGEGSVNVIVGVSATEAFAFGGGFSSSGQSGWRWNGTTWVELMPDLPLMNQAISALRTSSGTIYIGGNDQNQYPVIVRARLQ
ncbi:MAG: hypothetical protein JNM17_01165 [Archangium sp.]|nr:hypothetical protein [Archangium sp.]